MNVERNAEGNHDDDDGNDDVKREKSSCCLRFSLICLLDPIKMYKIDEIYCCKCAQRASICDH